MSEKRLFSSRLEVWLGGKEQKTLDDLVEVFGEKSFAVALLLLMFIPALPLPTGGISHIFEIISILFALEMIVGRKTIWLPRQWGKLDVSGISKRKSAATLIKKLKWAERHSKPRLKQVIRNELFLRVTGLFIGILCAVAFLAPPFSGLDTLPSLAVVFIALSIIFEDIILSVIGLVVGTIGIATVLFLGTVIINSFKAWF